MKPVFILLLLYCQIASAQLLSSDAPISKTAHALVQAINSHSVDSIREFIKTYGSAEALKSSPVAEQEAFWVKVASTSNGLEIKKTINQKGVFELEVETKSGGFYERIYLFVDKADPEKYTEAGILPIPSPADESALSFSNMKVKNPLKTIEEKINYAAAKDLFSGVVLIAKGDKIVFQKSIGFANRSFNQPNNLHTKFHLGSMDKMYTSIAISKLIEQGKLHYEDHLINLLPEYPNKENANKITVSQLLSHSSGLRMLFENPNYDNRKKYATHFDIVKTFGADPLLFAPGSKWSYSNEGFVILGAIIEKITGVSYFDFIRQTIFEPAGMNASGSFALDDNVSNLATGYGRFEDDLLGMKARRPNLHFLGYKGNASGGGYSTAYDLLKFSQALKNNSFISENLLDSSISPKKSKGYGFGFILKNYNNKKIFGHGGGGPNSGINSHMNIFKDGSYTVIVLSNYDAPFASIFCERITEFLAWQ
jgi:D-alanyl-D-alanine carboxypeptidase